MKKGLLLLNLGTPERPEVSSVRRYLAEFLSDKRVIDLPAPLRYILVYAFILPFRPKQSAEAYRAIWTEQGSPLLIHSQDLLHKIQKRLDPNKYQVALAMRYGMPSIAEAIETLSDCQHVTILPLYPQYSSAATGSSIEKTINLLSSQATIPSLSIIRDFYQHPAFIKAQSQRIKPYLKDDSHILFSYHGLPERHLHKTGCKTICPKECKPIASNNQSCYRAQCFETSRLLAQALNISADRFSLGFQSRLGKTPWIKPYTDELLVELINKGIKRLLVACPSFVSDCLETLEEIGIRAKEQWLEAGGEELILIPCLNSDEHWIDAVIEISNIEKLQN